MIRESSKPFVDRAMHNIAASSMVLDVGGGDRFGKWLKEYESLFTTCRYQSFDYDPSTNADVVGDIHALPLPDNSIDAIICSSVLEHVRDPLTAMQELTRVLKPQGKMFLYVPSIYPYHSRPGHYPDLWRFFDDTIRELFKQYSSVEIQKRGGYFLALSFFVPMQHRLRWLLNPIASGMDALFRTDKRTTTAGYYVYAIK
jgi:ubiquinone/menaquinone biosynthesis C-methylase UbiE